MGYLPDLKTRTIFVTGSNVKKNGKPRAIVIESKPEYAIVGLHGMRERYSLAWEAIYELALSHHAANLELETQAERREQRNQKSKTKV